MSNEWIRFYYRDFYDWPRAIVVWWQGVPYFLDCPFNDTEEDYPSNYQIYRLNPDVTERLDTGSWRGLKCEGTRIGEIPIASVHFDPTRRSKIHVSMFRNPPFEDSDLSGRRKV